MRFVDTLSRSPPSTAPTTPPPDLEKEEEQDRFLEEQARQQLERDGCPPCYPADPAFLARDPPEQYRGTISYWGAFPSFEGGVLCAQWKDWKKFRDFQGKTRRYYLQRKSFAEFTKATRERRRRHHLEGDVCLHSDPGQQSRSENWIEFQNYHLHTHEELEKEVQVETENLDTARKKLEAASASETSHAAICVKAYEVRLASARSRVELHGGILLPWIEQQRIAMVVAQHTTVDDTGGHDVQIDAIRRAPTSNSQKRKPKTQSVLGPARSAVSKPAPRKRSLQRQKSETLWEAENVASDSSTSHNSISWTPNLQKSKPRSAKENAPLRPFRPQKVIKTAKKGPKSKRPADINANLRPASEPCTTSQRNRTQRAQSTRWESAQEHPPKAFATRSGRKSRRPERPGFVSCG